VATRISVFIDGSNLYHILKEVHHRHDLDFEAFIKLFETDPRNSKILRQFNPVNYYNSIINAGKDPKSYQKQQVFFADLQKITNPTFQMNLEKIKHYGRLKYRCRKCGAIVEIPTQKCPTCGNLEMLENSSEKGVDVRIAVDMVLGAVNNEYDHAVLVSEDSDFVPAIQAVKSQKKMVEVVLFRKRGYELRQTKPYWIHEISAGDLTWRFP
jgi:uncharacterized LabA/DUF88 family protein